MRILAVSPIGLGCMSMSHAYGDVNDRRTQTDCREFCFIVAAADGNKGNMNRIIEGFCAFASGWRLEPVTDEEYNKLK